MPGADAPLARDLRRSCRNARVAVAVAEICHDRGVGSSRIVGWRGISPRAILPTSWLCTSRVFLLSWVLRPHAITLLSSLRSLTNAHSELLLRRFNTLSRLFVDQQLFLPVLPCKGLVVVSSHRRSPHHSSHTGSWALLICTATFPSTTSALESHGNKCLQRAIFQPGLGCARSAFSIKAQLSASRFIKY